MSRDPPREESHGYSRGEDVNDQERLINRLQQSPPDTKVWLEWRNSHDTVTEARGTILNYDPTVTFRHIETDDRQLVLNTDPSSEQITVAVCTPTGTALLGTLELLWISDQPVEPLRITDTGVEVPPCFVGYTGWLRLEHLWGSAMIDIPEPGLSQYDSRLFVELEINPTISYDGIEVSFWPVGGPERRYETVDERTFDPDPDSDPSPREQRYGEVNRLCATVTELSQTVFADQRLEESLRTDVIRVLHEIQSRLLFARQILLEPDSPIQPWDNDEIATYDWKSYTEILNQIETKTAHLEEVVSGDETIQRLHRSDAKNVSRIAIGSTRSGAFCHSSSQ